MNEPLQESFTFYVDGKEFIDSDTSKPSRLGREIKVLAGISGEYQLFMEVEGDKPDNLVSDDIAVELSGSTKHFYAVPPATFGKL